MSARMELPSIEVSAPESAPASRATYARLGAALALVAFALPLAGCGDDGPPEEDSSVETLLARDRAADCATWADRNWSGARQALLPLVERKNAAAEDLLRMACVELSDTEAGSVDAAKRFLDRAEKIEPENPVLLWCKARLARADYENDAALAILLELQKQRPDDFLVELLIANVRADLGDIEGAERGFRKALDIPAKFTADWRVFALYRMGTVLNQSGRREEAGPYWAEYQEYDARGIKSPGEPEFQAGTLGQVTPASPGAPRFATPSATTAYTAQLTPNTASIRGAFAVRLSRGAWTQDVGAATGQPQEEHWAWTPTARSLVTFGPNGVRQFESAADGAWSGARTLLEGNVYDAVPFDRENRGRDDTDDASATRSGDRDLDLLVLLETAGTNELRLLENIGGEWSLDDTALLVTKTPAAGRIRPVDFDHDGDLDVIASFEDGLHALRNDGFDVDAAEATALTDALTAPNAEPIVAGTLTDVSATFPFPSGSYRAITEDVDADQDVDIVLVGAQGVRLLDDTRGAEFVDATDRLPAMGAGRVAVADFDGTSWPDFAVFTDSQVTIHRQTIAGVWLDPLSWPIAAAPTGEPVVVDLDLDGTTDLLWPADGVGVAGLLAPGFENGGVAFDLARAFGDAKPAGAASLQVADVDDDRDFDVVHTSALGVHVLRADGVGSALRFDLMGYKNNSYGIGAIVELRDGRNYRRVYWRGDDGLVGFGGADAIDFVKVTWPNGTQQWHFDLPVAASLQFWGRKGPVGSCPFLYTWNGTTYEYITDVLGITPLGLPMAPGMIVPPDHDEYVLVRGEQLVPKDGVYEMVLTEELREVTYLDRVRLDVIDHPADTEIFPNERFTFPPFPEAHVHTVKDPLVPLSVTDDRGRDWTQELGANDDDLAAPFDPIGGPFQGLATPHTLELTFDAERFRSAKELRLLMNGWLFWTDASVNMAAARHPVHAFVPPMLQVPDGNGGWRDTGPPLGFPAGKLKTMVVDVTDLVNRDDPRMRIHSTLRLYWDSIRLAVDADDAPIVTTSIDPNSAHLWDRGFSEPIVTHGDFGLEWFDWDQVADLPRWNQHPGMYTRFGDTLPLVTEVDDLLCVLGAGDALTLRFDASGVPPLKEGWRRDYLVFFDGWAKDRDPNTIEALNVEPLPFHGMSGYPYGPDESFPDDEVHRAWREEWQTRPAKQHIDSLVPRSAWDHRPIDSVRAADASARASSGAPIDAAYHQRDSGE